MENDLKKPTITRAFKRKIIKKGEVVTAKFRYEAEPCRDFFNVFRTDLETGERLLVKVG